MTTKERITKAIHSLEFCQNDLIDIAEQGDAMESMVATSICNGVAQLLDDCRQFSEALEGRA